MQTKFYKIPKFGVRESIVSKIQPIENVKVYKEMYGHSDARPDGHTGFFLFSKSMAICPSNSHVFFYC